MTGEGALALWAAGAGGIAMASAAVGAVVVLPPRWWRELPWPEARGLPIRPGWLLS